MLHIDTKLEKKSQCKYRIWCGKKELSLFVVCELYSILIDLIVTVYFIQLSHVLVWNSLFKFRWMSTATTVKQGYFNWELRI